MRDVYVIGAGITDFGELWTSSLRDLFVAAATSAMRDASVDELDGMYVRATSPRLSVAQEHLASLLADYLGAAPVPCLHADSACDSGGAAFRSALFEVASGA